MDDVSLQLSEQIAKSQVFGSSDNIRCGRYKFLIKRVFAAKMDSGRFAFAECKVLEAAPNPQIPPYGDRTSKSFDLGQNPNVVGSTCALKVNFDGKGAKSAGSNIKSFILGLMGYKNGEASEKDIADTWNDLARGKAVRKGEALGVDANNQVIYADRDRQANPACGMVVFCSGAMKEKKKTREIKELEHEKREYVTDLSWECAGKLGAPGENATELVVKRRVEIEASMQDDEDDGPVTLQTGAPTLPTPPPATNGTAPQVNGNGHAAPPPPAAFAPPPPPAAPAPFVPTAPWVKHPAAAWGATPDQQFFWSNPTMGGTNAVKSLADLQAGR